MATRFRPLVAAAIFSISLPSAASAADTISGTAVATAAAQAGKSPNSSQCKKDKGLFDRLGGFFGIAGVVNNFSDAILVESRAQSEPGAS